APSRRHLPPRQDSFSASKPARKRNILTRETDLPRTVARHSRNVGQRRMLADAKVVVEEGLALRAEQLTGHGVLEHPRLTVDHQMGRPTSRRCDRGLARPAIGEHVGEPTRWVRARRPPRSRAYSAPTRPEAQPPRIRVSTSIARSSPSSSRSRWVTTR